MSGNNFVSAKQLTAFENFSISTPDSLDIRLSELEFYISQLRIFEVAEYEYVEIEM